MDLYNLTEGDEANTGVYPAKAEVEATARAKRTRAKNGFIVVCDEALCEPSKFVRALAYGRGVTHFFRFAFLPPTTNEALNTAG